MGRFSFFLAVQSRGQSTKIGSENCMFLFRYLIEFNQHMKLWHFFSYCWDLYCSPLFCAPSCWANKNRLFQHTHTHIRIRTFTAECHNSIVRIFSSGSMSAFPAPFLCVPENRETQQQQKRIIDRQCCVTGKAIYFPLFFVCLSVCIHIYI